MGFGFGRRNELSKGDPELLISSLGTHSPVVEAFRSLRTNIQFTDVNSPAKVIVVTSPSQDEGKSSVAANLASVIALAGSRCILIDADLRKPVQARQFDVSGRVGLTNVLMGSPLTDAVLQETGVDRLQLVPSGPKPPNPAELLGSEAMGAVIAEARGAAEYVIVDTPPLLPVTDAALLAPRADGVILVIRAGVTQRQAAQRAKQLLESVGARILGVVVNGVDTRNYGYRYYYRYYDSGETRRKA